MRYQQLTANFSGKVASKKLEGRDYFVIPTVMMVEGVHEVSGGALYYPADELGRLPEVWDHKPAVIFHPKDDDGNPISACKPETLEKHKVGVILNTTFESDGNKLKTETWLDKARLKTVSPEVYEAVKKGQVVEVSIGVFSENDDTAGEWNGEAYVGTARNYKPDHLALLPGLIGACSVEDGAGLGVNESKQARQVITQFVLNELKNNDQSNNLLHEKLYRLLTARFGSVWTIDVFGDSKYVVYELGDRFYKLTYTMSGDDPVLGDTPEMVDRVVEYRTATVTANESGSGSEDDMSKKALVDGLIANKKSGFEKSDHAMLMGWSEEKLKKFVANSAEPKEDEKTGDEGAGDGDEQEEAVKRMQKSQQQNNQLTPEQWLKSAPAPVRRMMANAAKIEKATRKRLIDTITANSDAFTEEELNAARGDEPVYSIETLEKLAAMARRSGTAGDDADGQYDPLTALGFGADFSGNGFPSRRDLTANALGDDEPGLDLPSTMDDDKK